MKRIVRKRTVPELKYVVYPGPVKSITDGQVHFIPSDHLIFLYKVDPKECLVISPSMNEIDIRFAKEKASRLNLIPLHPKMYGDYTIPSGN